MQPTDILPKIEQAAKELEGNKEKHVNIFSDKETDIPLLNEIAEFTCCTPAESAIFSIAVHLTLEQTAFTALQIGEHIGCGPLEKYQVKKCTGSLVRKKLLVKTNGRFEFGKRLRNFSSFGAELIVPDNIIESLAKNEFPIKETKPVDVFTISEMFYQMFTSYEMDNSAESENPAIKELEKKYSEISLFKISAELNLQWFDKLVLYYIAAFTAQGEERICAENMFCCLFTEMRTRMFIKREFIKQSSPLFLQKIIEFSNDLFQTDSIITLTSEGVEKIFGADSFLVSQENFHSGMCRLIKKDSIKPKELFYNKENGNSVSTLKEFLLPAKYNDIVKRLEEQKMNAGLTVLFYGFPGTGKTETVYQLARETGRDILMADISQIRDKYVGESEKRLKEVFDTYKKAYKSFKCPPILLLNEADALIGKRIDASDSVDMMNNAMQNIMLQALEDFQGIFIATTNLTNNIDNAFERRFLYKIKFEKPSVEERALIWQNKINSLTKEEAAQIADVYDFSGGQIDNITRRVFLDAALFGNKTAVEEIMHCCREEEIVRTGRVVGFKV